MIAESDSRVDNPRNAFHKDLGEANFPVFAFEYVILWKGGIKLAIVCLVYQVPSLAVYMYNTE